METDRAYFENHFNGFDYLRAIMSVAVVAWHLKLFGNGAFRSDIFSLRQISASDVVNYQFLVLAVPVFFLISLFLFFSRIQAADRKYVAGRLKWLSTLYVAWCAAWILAHYQTFLHILSGPGRSILLLFASSFYSPFYFFVTLILLMGIAWMCKNCRSPSLRLLLAGSLLVIVFCTYTVRRWDILHFLAAYWNPLNFLPYVFIAALGYRYWHASAPRMRLEKKWHVLLLMFFASGAAALLEIAWLPDAHLSAPVGYALPPYTRISVVIGASAVFFLFLWLRRRPSKIITLMSDYSLGLYCLHLFVIQFYVQILSPKGFWGKKYFIFGVTIVISYCIIAVFRYVKYRMKNRPVLRAAGKISI